MDLTRRERDVARAATARSGHKMAPGALQALLMKTPGTLFADDKDKRLYRVFEPTYFQSHSEARGRRRASGYLIGTYRHSLAVAVSHHATIENALLGC